MMHVYLGSGIKIALGLFWLVMAFGVTPALAQDGCYADWSESAAVIKEQNLLSVETLSRRVTSELRAKLVKATLCRTSDGYVYVAVVRSDSGGMEKIRIDAVDLAGNLARVK